MPDEDDATLRPFRLAGGNQIRVLGPLETSILDALWDLTAASPTLFVSIEQVRVHLDLTAHYKTVQTVMNRLMEKGVLVRTGDLDDIRAHPHSDAVFSLQYRDPARHVISRLAEAWLVRTTDESDVIPGSPDGSGDLAAQHAGSDHGDAPGSGEINGGGVLAQK